MPVPAFLKGHRVDSRILFSFLIMAMCSFIFLKLASEVVEGDSFALDRQILTGLRSATDTTLPIGPAWLRVAMIDMTSLGGVTILTLISVLTAGYLFSSRKAGTAAFVIAATAGGAILSVLLKDVVARSRPDLVTHLVEVNSSSFPSGHAMNSAITYLTLGALLARTERGRHVRIYLLAVAIALTLVIGASRVYLGVHWPSDVLAGWCVGATWAALCSLVARTLQRNHTLEPATSSEGPEDHGQP
ncbi:MAG: phosphatase PAP2 family protein [Sphingobium sp.]